MNICVRRRAWCREVADAAQRGQTPKGECRSQRYFIFKVDQVQISTKKPSLKIIWNLNFFLYPSSNFRRRPWFEFRCDRSIFDTHRSWCCRPFNRKKEFPQM